MKQAIGCVSLLIGLAVFTVVNWSLLQPHLPAELLPWVAGVSALLITLGLSCFVSLVFAGGASRADLLKRAKTGTPPNSNEIFAATGVARPKGTELRSPISGTPCVAYQYRVYERIRIGHEDWQVKLWYWGYGAVPFSLQTSGRSLAVAAAPLLSMDSKIRGPNESLDEFRTYIDHTTFLQAAPLVGTAAAFLTTCSELLSGQQAELRRDWASSSGEVELEGLTFEETLLPIDTQVSLLGSWSSDDRAIVPRSRFLPILAVEGPAGNLRRIPNALPPGKWSVGTWGAVLTALGIGLLYVAYRGVVTQIWNEIKEL